MIREMLNQYSYPIASLFVLLAVAWPLLRHGARPRGLIALALMALAFASGQQVLRTATSGARAVSELDQIIARGNPLLVELYSNY